MQEDEQPVPETPETPEVPEVPYENREIHELKYDHANKSLMGSLGFTNEKEAVSFAFASADRFNENAKNTNSISEMVEYFMGLEDDEQAVVLVGILQSSMELRKDMLKMELLTKLKSMGEETGHSVEVVTGETAEKMDAIAEEAKADPPAETPETPEETKPEE